MLGFLDRLSGSRKAGLRHVGRKIGLDIRLNGLNARDDLRLAHFLKVFGVGLVLDVGANRGQFAASLLKTGYTGKIVSFEALPEAHEMLKGVAAKLQGSWIVAPRVALSDRSGIARFHVTEADTASSLFPPKESFVSAAPQVGPSKTIEVITARLDDVLKDIELPIDGCFLKLDVQGSEALVMAGAPNVLAAAKGMMTELSLTPLYEGQPSAQDVLEAIYAAGFEIWDVWQGYRNPKTHRLNQIDLVCFKPAEKDAA